MKNRCYAPTKGGTRCKLGATNLGMQVCGVPAHITWGQENLAISTDEDMAVLRQYWVRTTTTNRALLTRAMQDRTNSKLRVWLEEARNPGFTTATLERIRTEGSKVKAFMDRSVSNIDKPIKEDSALYNWVVELTETFDFPAPTGRTVGELYTALRDAYTAVKNHNGITETMERAEKKATSVFEDEATRNLKALQKGGLTHCDDCGDNGHCKNHRDDTLIYCDRCAGTGLFIRGFENGKPKVGGSCNRCAGKGGHTNADARRNWGYDNNH